MAVQIPQIQQINRSPARSKNVRIQGQVQDNSASILQAGQQNVGLVQDYLEVEQKQKDETVDKLSYEAEQEYTRWNTQELQKLKNYQGDPTDAYVEYDKQSQQKMQDIISARGDLGQDVKDRLTQRMSKVYDRQYNGALRQRGAQVETYKNNLFESTVQLKSNSLSDNAGMVQEGNPGSFFMFDENLQDMNTVIAKRHEETGLATRLPDDAKKFDFAYTDDEGNKVKLSLSNMSKERMAVESSKGVSQAIDSLLAAGYTDKAKMMMDRYEGYVDSRTKAKLNKKFDQADVDAEAYDIINKLRTKTPEQQLEAMEKMPSGELRDKVLSIRDANQRRLDNMRKRQHTANYERLSATVREKMSSGQPFFGIADLENDPTFKETFDNMSEKQRQAIVNLVEPATKSKTSDLIRVQNDLNDPEKLNEIAKMSDEEFYSEYLGRLKPSDAAKYNERRQKILNPSNSQQRAAIEFTNREITKSLKNVGIITDGKKAQNDKLKAQAFEVFTEYQESLGRPLTPDETIKISKKIAADAIKTKSGFFGTSQEFTGFKPIKQPTQKSTGAFKFESSAQRRELKKEYKRQKGIDGLVKTTDVDFQNWLKTREG